MSRPKLRLMYKRRDMRRNRMTPGLRFTNRESSPKLIGTCIQSHTVQEDCSICITPLFASDKKVVQTKCNHLFHVSCLAEWIRINEKKTCPCCRRVFSDYHSYLIKR